MAKSPFDAYKLPGKTRLLIWFTLALVPVFELFLLALALSCIAGGLGLLVFMVHPALVDRPGRIYLWLLFPAFGLVATGFILARSFVQSFIYPRHFEPAVWVNLNREPELVAFIQDVCATMGAKFPDAVLLKADADFAVFQGRVSTLNANPRGRILILGLPILPCITVNELRAVLFHEFAHFTGGDTLYSRVTLPVWVGIDASISHLEMSKPASANLGLLAMRSLMHMPIIILRAYGSILALLAASISRQREARADRIAANLAGTHAFSSGLQRICAYDPVFREALPGILEEIRRTPGPPESCYRLFRKRLKEFSPLARQHLAVAMTQGEDKRSTHPALGTRIAQLPAQADRYNDPRPALALLREYKAYEKIAGQFMLNEYEMHRRYMQQMGYN